MLELDPADLDAAEAIIWGPAAQRGEAPLSMPVRVRWQPLLVALWLLGGEAGRDRLACAWPNLAEAITVAWGRRQAGRPAPLAEDARDAR